MAGALAVLDIGKTNVKVAIFDSDGALLWERSAPNRVLPGPPYPHADVEGVATFFVAALRDANQAHRIATIVPTTHACAGALVDEAGLVLPVMDYEFDGLGEIAANYAAIRPAYGETLSPELPLGLNQGRQIAWQRVKFPDAFARAKFYLTYPQYWAWRLTGVAASEVTLLGAHSDLWDPRARRPSSLAAKLDLSRLTPPLRPAWARLGLVKPEIAAAMGLDPATEVLNGLHDTNASLLPHLASRKPPFAIVSTGTWVILMAPGVSVEGLREADDMLANVDVERRPVACARFMGGREYSAILGEPILNASHGAADEASLARVLAAGALALPCFAPQGGPFVNRKGEIRGDVAPQDRPALATLYIALMSDLMLSKLGGDRGDVIVEGSFAANAVFCGLLAALRPAQRLWAADDAAGAARGAALLARWPVDNLEIAHQKIVTPLAVEGLSAYRTAWIHAIDPGRIGAQHKEA